jgi:replicative DNA helicase
LYQERLQPHNIEAEEAVIGSLLIDSDSILKVVGYLTAADFYQERGSFCFEACVALFQRREAINQVTITHELNVNDRLETVGGGAYLSHLVSTVPTSLHIEHYAKIVRSTATMRRLISAASEIATIGYEGTSDDESAISDAEKILFKIRSGKESGEFIQLREVLDQFLENRASSSELMGQKGAPILTGFNDLDDLLGGLQPSDLVILAARPSVGKSSLALNFAMNASSEGASVGIFSLEMSREQLAIRVLSSASGVNSHRLRLGLFTESEEERIITSIGKLSELSIFMDDTPLQGILEMRSKARRLYMEHGLDMLVVDYLQLIEGSSRSGNRVQEISEISRALKGMARDLNIPVIAVSQLSRAVELRTSHRPQLSDLRDSGSIEQDADVVMFIYREDMYSTEEEWMQQHPDQRYPKNIAELLIAKHRHGPNGSLKLLFQDELVSFRPAPIDREFIPQ